jgi:hypothetical protein
VNGNAGNAQIERKNSSSIGIVGKRCRIEPVTKIGEEGGAHVLSAKAQHGGCRYRNGNPRKQRAVDCKAIDTAGGNAATPVAALNVARRTVRASFGIVQRAQPFGCTDFTCLLVETPTIDPWPAGVGMNEAFETLSPPILRSARPSAVTR